MDIPIFYYRLLWLSPLQSATVIISGFIYRVLNIMIFAVVIKIFLLIVSPASIVPAINQLSSQIGMPPVSPDGLFYLPIAGLTGIVLFQFCVGKLHLKSRSSLISALQFQYAANQTTVAIGRTRHILVGLLPNGLEGITRVSEILLFYLCIFIVLTWANPLIAVIILVAVPPLVFFLIRKKRANTVKNVEMAAFKKNLGNTDDADFQRFMHRSLAVAKENRNDLLTSDLLGGILIAVILLIIMASGLGEQINQIGALLAALGVRFAIVYARELANETGALLQQGDAYDELLKLSQSTDVGSGNDEIVQI